MRAMFRAVCSAARRLEQCHVLQQGQLEVSTSFAAVSSSRSFAASFVALVHTVGQQTTQQHYSAAQTDGTAALHVTFGDSRSSDSSTVRPQPLCVEPPCGSRRSVEADDAAGCPRGQPPFSLLPAPLTASAQSQGWFLHPPHLQQLRFASRSGAAAKSKSKSKGRGGGGGGGDSRKAADAPPAPRVRTPQWARMPLLLASLTKSLRRRTSRLLTLRKELQAEAAQAETGGWAAAGKAAAAQEAAKALPIPPKDSGQSELAEATAADTGFEAAHGAMRELSRRGVCLSSEQHLAALLRKASTPEHLSAVLELLRSNHLVQAAARLGEHGPGHSALHSLLVQECVRVRTAEPLVRLWDSLYEYGMEPSGDAAKAAVQAAVALQDGPAAAALLALSGQYTRDPLAEAEEARAVLGLLSEGQPEEAARLRELLPRLGFAAVAS